MKMYLEAGSSYRQLAELTGLNEVTVARRIRSATMRLVSGEYLQCLRHRELLSSMELRVARDFYLSGLPIRAIVLRHGWTLYSVRATINKIRRLAGRSLRPTAKGKRKRIARCRV